MTQVANVNYNTKRILLHPDTVVSGFDCIAAYFEINALRQANANNEQNYRHMLSAEGNIPKGGGNYTPRYALSDTGWRYIPYPNVSHTLSLLTEPVSQDGLSGRDVFDRTSLSVLVEIDEVYEKIEIREVNTGTVPALTDGESALLSEIAVLKKILANKNITDPVSGQQIIYDDDDITPLLQANAWENTGGTIPYQGNGINRRDKLV